MEIQIDTKKKYRGKGLATVAAAYLIAHSLENNMDPGWDAATQTSAKFAEKLGFTPQGTYFMYVFTDSKFLVHLRKVVQKFKKMRGVTAVLKATRNAYGVLAFGVMAAIGSVFLEELTPFFTANLAILGLAFAEIVRFASQLFYARN